MPSKQERWFARAYEKGIRKRTFLMHHELDYEMEKHVQEMKKSDPTYSKSRLVQDAICEKLDLKTPLEDEVVDENQEAFSFT